MNARTVFAAMALLLPGHALAADCEVWSQSRCDAQNQAAIELRAGQTVRKGGGGDLQQIFAGEVIEFNLQLFGGEAKACEGRAVAEGFRREGGGRGGGELEQQGVAEEEALRGIHWKCEG